MLLEDFLSRSPSLVVVGSLFLAPNDVIDENWFATGYSGFEDAV